MDNEHQLIQEIDTNAIMQALPHLRDVRGKFIGVEGNIGCLRGDTKIHDPVDGSDSTIEQRFVDATAFHVLTLGEDGPTIGQALPPIKGPVSALYRVSLSNGASLVGTAAHKLLTVSGWRTVGELLQCAGATLVAAPSPQDSSVCATLETSLSDISLIKVTSVIREGKGHYFDFHVPGTNSYAVGGVWHHNSGKTTACNMLARIRQAHDGPTLVLFEPLKGRFKELLGRYYANPKRWGFTFQMHALQARFRQHTLAAELAANGIDVVQDRTIYADGCFGMTVREDHNMDGEEWGIYEDTFGCMKRNLRYPDVLVYLRTTPDTCHEHMRRRNRSEEAGVPLDYLRRIHDKHEMLADAMSRYTRVLRVDWNEFGDVEMLNGEINKVLKEERPFMRTWNSV